MRRLCGAVWKKGAMSLWIASDSTGREDTDSLAHRSSADTTQAAKSLRRHCACPAHPTKNMLSGHVGESDDARNPSSRQGVSPDDQRPRDGDTSAWGDDAPIVPAETG